MTIVEDITFENWPGENSIIESKTECLLPVCCHSCSFCKPISQQLQQFIQVYTKQSLDTDNPFVEEHLVSIY